MYAFLWTNSKLYQIARFLVSLVVKSLKAVLWVFQVWQDFVFLASHTTVWLTGMTLLFILCSNGPISTLIKTNDIVKCCYSRFFSSQVQQFWYIIIHIFHDFSSGHSVIYLLASIRPSVISFEWKVCKHFLPYLWNT